MRVRTFLPIAATMTLVAPSAASAYFPHAVGAGESLSSIAATDGLSVAQLAAANGLAPDAHLIAGSTLMIPPQMAAGASASTGASGTTAAQGSGATATAAGTSAAGGEPDGDSDDPSAGEPDRDSDDAPAPSAAPASSTTSSGGSYVVQPGDSLSAIAARSGTSVSALAAANGVNPNGLLLSGTVLRLTGPALSGGSPPQAATPASSSAAAATSQPVGATAEGSPSGGPFPTPERVSASQVGQLAAANGVPPSLAQAIGWQESGFNNDLVSSADARGVMQILPGTWNWIGQTLAGSMPLSPASAIDNVRGGVLLLHSLLNATGGNPALAAAGYYQGLPSVRQNGLFPSTQQYVNNVMALAQRFGGG